MKVDTPIAQLSPEKGFEWFFNEYWQPLRYYAFRIVNDVDVAEDAVQRSFIALHENSIIKSHLKKADNELKSICKSWLYTTTRNWCLNWLKKEISDKKKADNIVDFYYERLQEDVAITRMVRGEIASCVHSLIQLLPAECAKVFMHLYVYENTVRETSEILGLEISTIKNQKGRGLLILSNLVDEDLNIKQRKVAFGPKLIVAKEETDNLINWEKIAAWAGAKRKRKKRTSNKPVDEGQIFELRKTMPPRHIAKFLQIPIKKVYAALY